MWYSTVGCLVTFTLSLLGALLVAEAQPTGKVYRIGRLNEGVPPVVFLEAMRLLGYVEGHNLFLEQRQAETREQLPALAAELVTHKVDLIVTNGTPATRAAMQATTTIPIVFSIGNDPVQSGLVASYARPGGNVTGFVGGLYGDKQLEILKAAVPGIARVACLCREPQDWSQIVAAARGLGLEIQDIKALGLESQHLPLQRPEDFDRFFAVAQRAGADAVLMPNMPSNRYLPRIAELAAQSRLPAIASDRGFVKSGGLLAYGPKSGGNMPRVSAMVDKILQGAKPADIPVEQHTHFTLAINLKTAKALGITMPPSLLLLADEVIQ